MMKDKKLKFLIYGEYSALGKSLAKGFNELGHYSKVFSPFGGDGFKNIDSDYILNKKDSLITKNLKLLRLIPCFLKFDIILILNPVFFRFIYLGPLIILLFKIFRKKIILVCCGDDVEYIRSGEKGLIGPWMYDAIALPKKLYFKRMIDKVENNIVASSANFIVPVMYDYAEAWRLSPYKNKVTKTIPLACDGVSKSNNDMCSDKINITHGITRADVKGTPTILNALEIIKNKYINRVEINVIERMPYKEYLVLLEKTDILIDQCKSNSYGMNAIYGMLDSKIVLTAFNTNAQKEINVNGKHPIIPIKNDVADIVEKLESLLAMDKNHLADIKRQSKSYAEKLHSPKAIASQYISLLISDKYSG